MRPTDDDAVALRERLRVGDLCCAEVAYELLVAIGRDDLNAWAAVDPDAVRERAAALDEVVPRNREALPLFGVPVAIKDNFDTADLPTEYGSPIFRGWRPSADAPVVSRLLDAGAIIAGKVKCAEFAWMTPSDTLNPLDRTRTPGGSSSGSAAAVAAHTVPLATGTQTAGSINRPASYCGIVGYKPTFGRFSRAGVKMLAESLDTVGMLGRTVRDLELVAGVLSNDSPGTASTSARPSSRAEPRLAFARTPYWSRIGEDARAAIEAAVGDTVEELDLPQEFAELTDAQTTIQVYETAQSLAPELNDEPELLSDELRAALIAGTAIPPADYAAAKQTAASLGPRLVTALSEFDGVLTPSTDGVPPVGLSFTGDPLFARAWTLIGAPCVSVPVAWTDAGLPAGLQVVGAPGRDDAVLGAAASLMSR
jgi:amidase